MAADIVPVRLGLTKGDLYTLWAPRWRDAGDEWEAFLGKDEDLYAFESVADLVGGDLKAQIGTMTQVLAQPKS